jgi:cell division protease FtsH
MLPSQDKTHRISIIPRGRALGYTLHLPEEDRYLQSREEMIDWMVVALGGRVAEHVVFHDVTTGAANDLQKVYEVSRKMVAEYGMGTQIGSRRLPLDDYSVSDATRRMLDEEQQELTDLAMRRARKLIEANRDALEALAVQLLEHEVLEREDIDRLMDGHRPPASVPRIAATDPEPRS